MAKKRSHGNGSVKKLSSGTWRGQIMDGYRDNGKRNIVSFSGKTKGEVLDKIRDYWESDRKVESTPKMTFGGWADIWYADYRTQVQPSTYCNYKYTLNILKAYFADRILAEIKTLDINRFNDYLLSTSMSKSYISKCRAMLIQIFDAAEANELIAHNPARKSKSIKNSNVTFEENVESKKDAFSDFEQKVIKENLDDNMIGHSIRLMLGTGIRTQELLALQREDISEDGLSLSITKAIKTVDGKPVLGPPKSKRGKRIIPIPESYKVDAIYMRNNSGTPYIWTSKRESGLFDVGSFRRRYYSALKKIPGVRSLSPHCCRHTYITNLEKRGVPMQQIARLAGHSQISTTDVYLHADIKTLSNAVSVLNHE